MFLVGVNELRRQLVLALQQDLVIGDVSFCSDFLSSPAGLPLCDVELRFFIDLS